MQTALELADLISQWAIPAIILLVILVAWRRRVPMYESFVAGAKEGFGIAIMIIPYLVAILLVIAVFRASGALADIKSVLAVGLGWFGLEEHAQNLELIPLALIRPLSGSGARGVMLELFDHFGPDSFIGYAASVMQGSTETTFYILTVYYGSVGIKRIRHTLPACLLADAAGLIAAVVFASLLYRAGG
jgi:spore maturation protein B